MVARPSAPAPLAAPALRLERWAVWAAAAALPLLFLHVSYQPTATVDFGSTELTVALSDLALAVLVSVGLLTGIRRGFAPLAAGRGVWLTAALLVGAMALGVAVGAAREETYALGTQIVTAAKEIEYFLIAPAICLIVRSRRDLFVLVAGLTAWSCAMTTIGVLQFLGLVDEFEGRRPLQREPSFVGIQDFSALSAAALAMGLAVIALGARSRGERRLGWIGGVSGGLGVAIAGSLAGVLGVVLAATAAGIVAKVRQGIEWRRVAALIGVVLAVGGSASLLRSSSIADLLSFLGVRQETEITNPSYPHRTVLAYIGARMFLDHPIVGVGWLESHEQPAYEPYLDEAKRKFPTVDPTLFPSPEHEWGVQNAYVQTAADLGLVGLAALVAFIVAVLLAASRAALRAGSQLAALALLPLLWLLAAGGTWNAIGIVAGLPLVALTWLAAGLAVSAKGLAERGGE